MYISAAPAAPTWVFVGSLDFGCTVPHLVLCDAQQSRDLWGVAPLPSHQLRKLTFKLCLLLYHTDLCIKSCLKGTNKHHIISIKPSVARFVHY